MGLNNQLESATIFACPNWEAIWAGVFTFIAIWAGFGALVLQVFRRTANSSALFGAGAGMALWAVLLAIVAFFAQAGSPDGSRAHRIGTMASCMELSCFALRSRPRL